MSDKELRSKLIRLANEKPELRKDLLPVLSNKGRRESSLVKRFTDPYRLVDDVQTKLSVAIDAMEEQPGSDPDAVARAQRPLWDAMNSLSKAKGILR